MMNFHFYNPTRLLFGSGKIGELGAQKLPGKKALLLLSAGKSAKTSGALDKTVEQLKAAGVEYVTCANIRENPTKELVMEAAGAAKANGCDFIVALGGGAVLDSAVAVAAMATNPGDLWDYVNGGTGKGQPLVNKPLPQVTITLTAGTGSEINSWGVISKTDTHEKIGFGGTPELVPVLAVVDPKLMRTVPAQYTAYQGFDALFHNTEVMMSNGVNILSETLALSAIENIAKYLPRAVKDGNDLEAREAMLIASYKAGLAFNHTGVGYVHAIAHAMGGIYNTAHGLANAVIMPIVLEDYGTAVHPQLAHLAEITGVKTTGSDAEKANAFIAAIRQMNREMGLPTGFDFIEQKDFPQIIKWALAEGNGTYPVPVIYNEARMRHVLNRIVLEA